MFKLDRLVSLKKLDLIDRISSYKLVISLQPGNAWFELKLIKQHPSNNNSKLKIDGKINRISAYGKQPHCVKDPVLVNFCFCKIQID